MKHLLQTVRDAVIFTALVIASPVLLTQVLPGDMAMLGFVIPFVYAWWRGALPSRQLRRVSVLMIAGTLLSCAGQLFALNFHASCALLAVGGPASLATFEIAEARWRKYKARQPHEATSDS